jgi:hypothetical protein
LITDAGTNEIDDEFVIARATELALMATKGEPTNPQFHLQKVSYFKQIAQEALRKFPIMVNARRLS